jgi:hypothetical protein
MATLYSGGRMFDGEEVVDGHAVLEEDGRIKRVARAGEENHHILVKRGEVAHDNRDAFANAAARVAAE